jgi:hypothetical protein
LTELLLKTAIPIFLVALVLFNQWRYIVRIRQDSLPSGVTWMIWSFVAGVMFYSQLKEKGFESAWMFLAYSSGAAVVLIMTIRASKFEWQAIHKVCLSLAVAALFIAMFLSGKAGLCVNVSAHLIGTLPLWQKIWSKRSREPLDCWFIWLFCSTSNLALAIATGNLLIAPLYYFGHNCIMVTLLLCKQKRGTRA